MGGLRVGWIQMATAAFGFLFIAIWLGRMFLEVMYWTESGEFHLALDFYGWMGWIGLALSLVAWSWGLRTGFELLNQSTPISSPKPETS
jgi:hypothetical protein